MYEERMAGQVQSDMSAKIAAAQRAGYGNGADAPRPSGVLKAHIMHLRETLGQIEGQRNRIYGLMEKLLTPRPEPGRADKEAERVHHGTIEGDLEQLIAHATRLCHSFNEIADRLDSAV